MGNGMKPIRSCKIVSELSLSYSFIPFLFNVTLCLLPHTLDCIFKVHSSVSLKQIKNRKLRKDQSLKRIENVQLSFLYKFFQVCHVFRIGKMLSGGNADTGKRGSLITYAGTATGTGTGCQYKRPFAVGVVNISKIITKR